MAVEGILKVTPEQLMQKAESVSACAASLQRHLDVIKASVSQSCGYWNGEAGELHRKNYTEKEPVLGEILCRIREHSTDLQNMAENYNLAEEAVIQEVWKLPSDVIC